MKREQGQRNPSEATFQVSKETRRAALWTPGLAKSLLGLQFSGVKHNSQEEPAARFPSTSENSRRGRKHPEPEI